MRPNPKDFAGHAWAEIPRPGEAGVVLLLVLWVLVLLSTLILSLAQEWRTELQLTGNSLEGHQCHRLAEAGIYYALGKLVATRRGEEEASQGAPTFFPR
jgi:type II secretory pathway component PulK